MSKQTGDADKILDQMDMQACLNGTPKTYLKTGLLRSCGGGSYPPPQGRSFS